MALWPQKEAQRVSKRIGDNQKTVVFETGYGPSGLPHIGTFAEVARTSYVMNALKELRPDLECKIIAFSDDMDGLRNIPENIDNKEILMPHLGKPLSSVPDPFGETSSYAHYMNGKLQEFLDQYGFEYEFRSSTETYRGGLFDDSLRGVMDNYDAIRDTFIAEISADKRDAWSPFFPVCSQCGCINTTQVRKVDPTSYLLSYSCTNNHENYEGCGHQDETTITGGACKVGWKVDWALRWHTFGVDYEMHGKDLMSSATVSSRVCSILGTRPPTLYKYELFLDETGAKISKKIGNGISMDQWARYAPLGALLHFLMGNPNKARKMGLPILSKLIDDYLKDLRLEQDGNDTNVWYVKTINPDAADPEIPGTEISHSLLVNVAQSIGIDDADLLYDYAQRYDAAVADEAMFFQRLCNNVVAYASETTQPEQVVFADNITQLVPFLTQLRGIIADSSESDQLDGAGLQTEIYAIATENNLEQKEWFKFLYQILLKRDRGPRLGPLLGILGKKEVLGLLDAALLQLK